MAVLRTSDQDREKNGKFSCTMEDMDLQTMDTFTVRTTPAGCALVLAGYLDWSDMSEYSLKIRATDHAERGIRKSAVASVTIHVQDTNNHVPEFLQSSYWVALASDATAGSPVLTVRARDLDELNTADLKYKITSDVFAIDATRGTITLKQGLGSVTNKKYDFLVRATDQGIQKRQSSVNVSVSVHSTPYIPPRFAQSVYTKEVPENIRRGVALLTVRAKRSVGLSSAIEYSIVGGDPTGAFRIDAHTGILKLWKALDYEKAKQHVMVVRAVQKALSPEQPSLPTEASIKLRRNQLLLSLRRSLLTVPSPKLINFPKLQTREKLKDLQFRLSDGRYNSYIHIPFMRLKKLTLISFKLGGQAACSMFFWTYALVWLSSVREIRTMIINSNTTFTSSKGSTTPTPPHPSPPHPPLSTPPSSPSKNLFGRVGEDLGELHSINSFLLVYSSGNCDCKRHRRQRQSSSICSSG